jgi:hypothetical protein
MFDSFGLKSPDIGMLDTSIALSMKPYLVLLTEMSLGEMYAVIFP